jgi:hypothetical protein
MIYLYELKLAVTLCCVLKYLSVFYVEYHISATYVVLLLWGKAVTLEM